MAAWTCGRKTSRIRAVQRLQQAVTKRSVLQQGSFGAVDDPGRLAQKDKGQDIVARSEVVIHRGAVHRGLFGNVIDSGATDAAPLTHQAARLVGTRLAGHFGCENIGREDLG